MTCATLTQHDRQLYAGMAAFSLLTAELGAGVFSQEAVAVERVTTELGDIERLSTELADGAQNETQVAAEVTREAEAVEGAGGIGGGAGNLAGGGSAGSYDDLAKQYAAAIHDQVVADWPYEGQPGPFRVAVGFVGQGDDVTTVVAVNQSFHIYQDSMDILSAAAAKVLPEDGPRLVTWGGKLYQGDFFYDAHAEEFIYRYVKRGFGGRQLLGIGASPSPINPDETICPVCVGMLKLLRDAGMSSSSVGG